MKKLIITALLLVITASVGLANAPAKKGGKPTGDKAGLTQVVDDYFASMKASDMKKLAAFFAPDYSFTDLDGKLLSRDERLKIVGGQDNSKLVFADLNVRTYGGTGVVTGMATGADGVRTHFTQTWAWQGGRWWLVAAQRTTMTP
jgi:hypothetical protein